MGQLHSSFIAVHAHVLYIYSQSVVDIRRMQQSFVNDAP